jgi:uncharacterized protein YqgC (DUF456 family)
MTTIEAIESVDKLVERVGRIVANMRLEADELANEWDTLKSVGGGREDHAAALLSRLLPHFSELQSFAQIVQGQLGDIAHDPFQREKSSV